MTESTNTETRQVDEFGFTLEEREIANLLSEAQQKYFKLVGYEGRSRDIDPDLRLWMPAYDTLIDQLFARVVRRDYPAWGGGYRVEQERVSDG